MTDGWSISCKIALRWMPLGLTDDKSTSVQVMAWCRQATSHYLNQCWPRSTSPFCVTRTQWVKTYKGFHQNSPLPTFRKQGKTLSAHQWDKSFTRFSQKKKCTKFHLQGTIFYGLCTCFYIKQNPMVEQSWPNGTFCINISKMYDK